MNTMRTLSRLVILSLLAAAFALLTAMYGRSMPHSSSSQHRKLHRSPAPKIKQLPDFLGAVVSIGVWTVAGRVVFRLRLSPQPPWKGQQISLGLR